MKCGQGWLIKNTDHCYLLLINAENYAGLSSALRTYHGPWYMIKVNGPIGTGEKIIASVNDTHRVSVAARWGIERLLLFQVLVNNNTVFTGDEASILKELVYKK